ncbi:hypothetical protein LR032_03175 [Candidatus Bipolaricaulota bacterium]|nr:hypothetical protein [Candidatus Bipolaricaulota bacterium]
MMNNLFEKALSINPPWFVKEIRFDERQKKLDIFIDFQRGATFAYKDEESGIQGEFKAYDTINKTWRHLNFFQPDLSDSLPHHVLVIDLASKMWWISYRSAKYGQ